MSAAARQRLLNGLAKLGWLGKAVYVRIVPPTLYYRTLTSGTSILSSNRRRRESTSVPFTINGRDPSPDSGLSLYYLSSTISVRGPTYDLYSANKRQPIAILPGSVLRRDAYGGDVECDFGDAGIVYFCTTDMSFDRNNRRKWMNPPARCLVPLNPPYRYTKSICEALGFDPKTVGCKKYPDCRD